jgi:pimeloyl-ACP methyl ester carboxylesterase
MEYEKIVQTIPSFDGTPLYYEVRGNGPKTLVFVYGIACLINHWHYQLEHFARDYTVVSFDLRGHHKSGPVRDLNTLNVTTLAQDLIFLIEHLKANNVTGLGHSFGVPILLEAHRLRPDLFTSYVFINGFHKNPIKGMFGLDIVEPFFYFVKAQFEKNPVLWNSIWRTLVDNPITMQLAALAGGFNIKLTEFKDIEIYSKGVSQLNLEVFIPLFESLMIFEGSEILPMITQPSLIISGEKDNITPKSFQLEFKEKVPNAEYLEVPYGSHCTQLDFPEFVNLRIDEFLKGAGK